MGKITIEFADRNEGALCDCCGGRTIRLSRFVYSDGDAHAVYYCEFSDNHPNRYISAVVSLGEWGEDDAQDRRLAFPLQIRSTEEAFQITVVDADKSPWKGTSFLGKMLDRDEALKHEWIKEVFHITDHIVEEDQDVRAYFESSH
jgi:hypothetical protein